jgi:hypothetical protein
MDLLGYMIYRPCSYSLNIIFFVKGACALQWLLYPWFSTPYPHGAFLSYICTTLGTLKDILHMIVQLHIF